MKHTRRRALGLASTALCLACALTACGANGGQEGRNGNLGAAVSFTKPPTRLPVTTPVSKPIPTGLKVVFINNGYPESLSYWNGFQAASNVLGWDATSVKFDPTNPASIQSSIDSAIATKPDAVVVLGLVTQQFESSIATAKAAGVPLISAATPDPSTAGLYTILRSDVEYAYDGKMVADAIAADANSAGKTAHILQLTVPEIQVLKYEDSGLSDELPKKCTKCTVDTLPITLANLNSGAFTQQVVSYLQGHPDIDYIAADAGQLEDGLRAALAQAGLNHVTTFGFQPSNVQVKELQGGQAGAWAVQPLGADGWAIADLIARIKVGDSTTLWNNEHLGYLLTSGNSKGVNPDDPEFPSGYQGQFKKLWGKS